MCEAWPFSRKLQRRTCSSAFAKGLESTLSLPCPPSPGGALRALGLSGPRSLSVTSKGTQPPGTAGDLRAHPRRASRLGETPAPQRSDEDTAPT